MVTKTSPVLLKLRSNRTMAKAVVDSLIQANNVGAPRKTTSKALGKLHKILDDTESLLREAFNYREKP